MTTNNNWSSLDNAALIFPSAAKRSNTQVFRISCELYEKIDPVLLQNALDETIQIFRVYQSVLKRGLFWYYLESTNIMPVVHEESRQPCATIYNRNRKGLLFQVSYYKKRVNLEVYHVLSDGTGAMHFLRTLMTKYLAAYYKLIEPSLAYDASAAQMSDDSFHKYYTGSPQTKEQKHGIACRLRGWRYPEDRLKIITGLVSIQPLLDEAHKYHTTLTVYLCACLMNAISETVPARAKKRPVVLSVPVNLRNHFPSASARNFFGVLSIEYNYWNHENSFENIIKKISDDFSRGLSSENLARVINAYCAVEHNVFARITPLVLKDLALKCAYDHAMLRSTAGFSNVGIIKMPAELEQYIRSFDLNAGTDRLQVCLCSFRDRLSINFTSPFINSEIQRRFFRTLTELGAEVEITTNSVGNEKDEP